MDAFHIGVETIAYTRPAVWIIELGELPENAAIDEVIAAIQTGCRKAGSEYTVQAVRNLMPSHSGYPVKRTRTFFLGWRVDMGSACDVVAAVTTLIQHPIDLSTSYRGFLSLQHSYDWGCVGEYLVGSMLASTSASQCRCSARPDVVCTVHPCQCGRCGPDGLGCTWRKLCTDLLSAPAMDSVVAPGIGKATYLQVLEHQGGTGPPQQRARVLLNLFASMRQHHPLSDTLLLVDTSQNPPFGSFPSDGMAPTFTTTSQLWCLSAGRYLHTWELAALMGLDTQKLKLEGQSEPWFRKRLGLAVHVPNFGLALLAVLAKPLHECLA